MGLASYFFVRKAKRRYDTRDAGRFERDVLTRPNARSFFRESEERKPALLNDNLVTIH